LQHGCAGGLASGVLAACLRARDARLAHLLTTGHSLMTSDLADPAPLQVSAHRPLGTDHHHHQHQQLELDQLDQLVEFVQQCRLEAGTVAYRLPACRVRYQ